MRLFEPTAPGSGYVLKRFAMKFAILTVFAMAQVRTPWGFRNAALALSVFSAAICSGFALYRREAITLTRLNYWDEAIAFGIIASILFIVI